MIRRFILVSVACAVTAFAATALAQQSAPAATPAASAAPVPTPNCTKPDEYPGNLATEAKRQRWQKDYVAYVDCLRAFVQEQQALADPHVKAANAAINEYNASVKAYNEIIEKAKGG